MEKERESKWKKLSLSGNFSIWEKRLKTHFQVLDLWNYVESGEEIPEPTTTRNNQPEHTVEQLEAIAMNDILCSIEDDLANYVIHCETATDIYKKIKKFFQGGLNAERTKLKQ